jgi:hypothetical protein
MKKRGGQAILEYILMVVMLAVTVAVVIRNTNQTIYCLWTGLALQVSTACPDCSSPTGRAPDLPSGNSCFSLDTSGTN